MIGFFIKKNFFDGWENIFNIIISNLLTLPFAGIIFLGIWYGGPIDIFHHIDLIQVGCIFVGLIFIIVLSSAFSKNAAAIANFETVTIGGYFKNLGWAFKENFGFALLVAFIVMSCMIGIPFYVLLNSFYGVMFGSMLLFFSAIILLAFQWYLPLKALLGFGFKKTVKKCFEILFDNFGFSIFMALYSAVLLAISIPLIFTVPGFCGIHLGYVNALRLRLYKYDWLDQHKNLKGTKDRKNIPWEALINEDKKIMGKKSLKHLWKADAED